MSGVGVLRLISGWLANFRIDYSVQWTDVI